MLEIKRLDIAITTKCNFTCLYCRGNPGKRNRIPLEDVLLILDNFKQFNLEAVRLDGGEPFVYGEDIFSILEYLKDAGIKAGVFTNASLLNDRAINKLKPYQDLDLFVTLHTLNREKEIEATLKGLHLLAKHDISPELLVIISRKHIPTLRQILLKLPAMRYNITFRPIIPIGKAYDQWEEGFSSLQDEDMEYFASEFNSIVQDFPRLNFVNALPGTAGDEEDGYHKKTDGFVLHVDTDGFLLPSFAAGSDRYLGSALDKQSVIAKLSDPDTISYLENADSAILERIKSKEKPMKPEVIITN